MRILVLSDIHARVSADYSKEQPDAPARVHDQTTWMDFSRRSATFIDPLAGLASFASEGELACDVILVPGDICDRSDLAAFGQAWREIHALRACLGAKAIIGTAGNHDLDSRYTNSAVPHQQLAALTPRFPFGDDHIASEFWTHGVAQVVVDDCRFLLLNSCAAHLRPEEITHGRITDTMLARAGTLSREEHHLNVLVCHHHPQSVPGLLGSVSDCITDGEKLLQLLEISEQQWLVVHGHRHWAKIWYPSGESSDTVPVLSAGSVGALLPDEYLQHTSNQCHLIDLTIGAGHMAGAQIGRVKTWSYTPGLGWSAASVDLSLPHVSGFGARANLPALAVRLAESVKSAGGPVGHRELTNVFPELAYLEPVGLARLRALLSKDHAISLRPSQHGIFEIARSA